jgi:hypothetical protein
MGSIMTKLGLAAALVAVVGCRSNDRQQVSEKAQEAADQAEVFAQKAGEKAAEARAIADQKLDQAANGVAREADVARTQRDEFLAKSNEKLAQLDRELEALEAKAKTHTDQATKDAMANLRELRASAAEAYAKSKVAAREEWTDASAAFDAAYLKVEATFKDVAARLGYTPGEAQQDLDDAARKTRMETAPVK